MEGPRASSSQSLHQEAPHLSSPNQSPHPPDRDLYPHSQGDIIGSAEDHNTDDFTWGGDDEEDDTDEVLSISSSSGDEDVLLAEDFDEDWEPAASSEPSPPDVEASANDLDVDMADISGRRAAKLRFHYKAIIEKFSYGDAGAPLVEVEPSGHSTYQGMLKDTNSLWAPFKSKMDWEIAKWAKLRGPGSTAFTDLLKIEGVQFSSIYIIVLFIYCKFTGSTSSQFIVFQFT